MVILVFAVVTGDPRMIWLFSGQNVRIAYTAFSCGLVVYLTYTNLCGLIHKKCQYQNVLKKVQYIKQSIDNAHYMAKINKRPMGHITHLKNHVKSMNTFERSYDYIYYKIGSVVQEEIFKFRECTFAILLSPNVKRCGLSI